jgi:hypothetical protein
MAVDIKAAIIIKTTADAQKIITVKRYRKPSTVFEIYLLGYFGLINKKENNVEVIKIKQE